MFSTKPLILIVPAILAVPALAQTASQASATGAILTPPMRPASTIAPRQSLPAIVPAKTSIAPVAATPIAVGVPKAPIAVSTTRTGATPPSKIAPALSARAADSTLAQPSALPVQVRSTTAKTRRIYAAAVSLPTAPVTPPATVNAPVAVAPVAVAPTAPVVALPPMPATKTTPSQLASREARARDLTLARLDSQLARAEDRLDRAQARLTDGQKQLGSVTNLLQNAIITQGAGARGLHPFVRVAQRYLGTPYVWGGESARGFDCSGFIMRVMRDLGYQALPHSAAEQFTYGQPIAKNLLQPGDIVFFANTYKPGVSHVGIYLGNTRFIHAANSQVGTIVSSLSEQKWIDHYAGARRLMKLG